MMILNNVYMFSHAHIVLLSTLRVTYVFVRLTCRNSRHELMSVVPGMTEVQEPEASEEPPNAVTVGESVIVICL